MYPVSCTIIYHTETFPSRKPITIYYDDYVFLTNIINSEIGCVCVCVYRRVLIRNDNHKRIGKRDGVPNYFINIDRHNYRPRVH